MKALAYLSTIFLAHIFFSSSVHSASEPELSFATALQQLMQDSEFQSRNAAEEATAAAAESRSQQQYLPEFSTSLQHTRKGDFHNPITTENSAILSSSINIYKFGADSAAKEAHLATARLKRSDILQKTGDREQEVARALLAIIASKQQLMLAKQFRDVKTRSVNVARTLFERGSRSSQDVEKLTLDLQQEEISNDEALRKVRDAESDLREFAPHIAWQLEPVWPWTALLKRTEITSKILGKKTDTPQYASLNQKLAVARAQQQEAKAQIYPSFDLRGQHQWSQVPGEEPFNAPAGSYGRNWSVALSLTMPLYERGKDLNSYREALANETKINLELEAYKRSQAEQLQRALDAFTTSRTNLDRRLDINQRAKKLYDNALLAFQRGLLSVNDLLADQSRYLDSEEAVITSHLTVHKAVIDACAAAGLRLATCLN